MTSEASRLRCVPFAQKAFLELVGEACGAPSDWRAGDQVRYLFSYLQNAPEKPRTLIVERPYVDRHYSEEYGGYYASVFRRHAPHGARLHVFSRELTDASFRTLIQQAIANGDADAIGKDLQASYLGFVGVRPLASAPIGRTVLKPYSNLPSRVLEVASIRHDVHLAGFRLVAHGLPFQQQDRGVGACATTAIWSALARVMRSDGSRAATPLAVTMAATRHVVSGRALPAEAGLDLNQTLAAVQHYGYSPYILKPDVRLAEFQLALKCYLRSGIPVMLRLRLHDSQVHAITVCGYREGDAVEPAEPIEIATKDGTILRSRGICKVYVHDDRFGPYARMNWDPPPKKKKLSYTPKPNLRFDPYDGGFDDFKKPALIDIGIVPLYPKLRLTADDLVALACEFLPAARFLAGKEHRELLRFEPFFQLSGGYLAGLYSLGGPSPVRIERMVTSIHLSRYVGVLRFFLDDRFFCDVVFDTTDILRETPTWGAMLAILPAFEEHVGTLEDIVKRKAPGATIRVF